MTAQTISLLEDFIFTDTGIEPVKVYFGSKFGFELINDGLQLLSGHSGIGVEKDEGGTLDGGNGRFLLCAATGKCEDKGAYEECE